VTIRAVVLSDTHMRVGSRRRLPDRAYQLLEDADVILHAGDLVDASVLELLRSMAPVHAVLGNNDLALAGQLPLTMTFVLEGVQIGLIHDSGPTAGRPGRMRRQFPAADMVVFGHSHVPVDAEGMDGQRLFNPGSPTERRSQPHRTAGVLELADGTIRSKRIIVVDD
jgi:uncharacterized protein